MSPKKFLGGKEKLWNSVFSSKSGRYLKRSLFTGDLYVQRYQTNVVLAGERMNGKPSLCLLYMKPCNELFFLFPFPFCCNFPERWICKLQRDLGYFLRVTLSQVFLGSLLNKAIPPLCFSLARQSAVFLDFLLLEGNHFYLPRALFIQYISVPIDTKSKNSLDRDLLWKC